MQPQGVGLMFLHGQAPAGLQITPITENPTANLHCRRFNERPA
jgi:hypothetical protein